MEEEEKKVFLKLLNDYFDKKLDLTMIHFIDEIKFIDEKSSLIASA